MNMQFHSKKINLREILFWINQQKILSNALKIIYLNQVMYYFTILTISTIFIEINKTLEIDKNEFISYQGMCSPEPA